MLYNNNTENLLGLKDVIIEKIEDIGQEKHIHIKMHQRIHLCPECGYPTSKVHDYRTQLVRDLPMAGLNVVLHLKKRRHVCPKCGKRFDEVIDFLPRYHRFTNRVFLKVLNDLEKCISIKDIAEMYNMTAPTAAKVLNVVNYTPTKLPEVLSIDEFRGNSGGEKFQCILTDAKHHQVFDILPTRKLDDLYLYLLKFKNKEDVKFVVMDMTGNYKYIMKDLFPGATIIVDKYHYLRQLDWALERIRKDTQKTLPDYARLYFKHSRKLLIKDPAKLTETDYLQLQNLFKAAPKLHSAYNAKLMFRRFRECTTREAAAKELGRWIMYAEECGIPEIAAVAKTYSNWSKEILNSVENPYTNGFTEGCNNRIKVLKRVAFGMPEFTRFRKRILHIMNTVA